MKKKNHFFKLLLLALAAGILLVPALTSCANQDAADPENNTVSESAPVADESITFGSDGKIYLARNGQSEFQIVRSDLADKKMTNLSKQIKEIIETASGATVGMTTDWDDKKISNFEILLGDTTRAESIAAKEALLHKGFYVGSTITEDSVRILLLGVDQVRTEHAVDHFLAKCVVADENGNIVIDPDFEISDSLLLTGTGEKGAELLSDYRATKIPDQTLGYEGYALKSVTNIHMVSTLTGQYSVNRTRTEYTVGGMDLGIMMEYDDKMYMFFGDTFSGENQDNDWRNNTLAFTTDYDYTNGILFDTMLQDRANYAKELIPGEKINWVEMAKIPTGVIAIGDTIYLSFMSVNNWEATTDWACNYGSVAKSKDGGKSWTILKDLQWPGDSMFCQMFPVLNEKDGMIYIYGVTGGRYSITRLMRVAPEDYENFDAYEYLVGRNEDGSPIFEKGEEAMMSDYPILSGQNGEPSVMYSEYLEEWISVRIMNNSEIVISTAKEPWGPFSPNKTIIPQEGLPRMYGCFMHPTFTSEGGQKVALLISFWTPVYNTIVMEMTLNK